MKSLRGVAGGLIMVFFVALAATPAAAQSQNPQAANWFKIGLNQKDPQRKIAAYLKAVEADPAFVEALYNLGLTYSKQQDYPAAEQYLQRALEAKPGKTSNDSKLQILRAMVVVYKNLGRRDRAEATLLQAKNIAGDNKASAVLSAELAQLYFEQNRFEPALTELQSSIRLDPENRSKYVALAATIESTAELQRLYDRAEQAKRSGELERARSIFAQIHAQNPSFKDVQVQLTELDTQQRKLESAPAPPSARQPVATQGEDSKKATEMYEAAKRLEAEGNLEQAISAYQRLAAQSDTYYDEAQARQQELKQKLELERKKSPLEEQYAAGLAALEVQDWSRAVIIFDKILAVSPNFRDAARKKAEAQSGLDRESTDAMLARLFSEATAVLNRGDLNGALAAFEKVRKINPNYRNVSSRIIEVENALAKQNEPARPGGETPAVSTPVPPLDSLYQAALTAMVKEEWMQAAFNLEKLQVLSPNYRDVPDLLARTRVRLNMATKPESGSGSGYDDGRLTVLYFGIGFIVLLVLGPILFSPTARARLHIWRGNPIAAEEIYEKMLARYPMRLSLYPPLAELYLNEGRQDDYAIKVYKKALQVNLPDHKRKAIRTFITQNYLEEKKPNGDAS